MDLLVVCYGMANSLPAFERYGLASQLRRCALSVPANIAEGCGRTGHADRLRYLSIARGSTCELQTLLCAVRRLGYALDEAQMQRAEELLGHVARLLSGLRRNLATRASSSSLASSL